MGIWTWRKKPKPGSPQPIDPKLNTEVQTLCQVLRDLIALLDADGEELWRAWMASSLKALEGNDLSGAEDLSKSFGGMGSFNDLVIGQRTKGDGFEWAPGFQEANDQLNKLRTQAFKLTKEILLKMRSSGA